MNISKLVSVIIPGYNHEKYIQETIKSVISQTYQNIELIIINDGSPDEMHEKILDLHDACEKRFIKFTYIHRENKGLIYTLNQMLSLANGYYITAVASDDFFLKDKIEKQVNVLDEFSAYAMCYGNMLSVDENSKVIPKKYKTKYNKSGELFEDLLFRNFITAPTVMFKRSALESVGGYDSKHKIEDYPLWLKIAKKYKIYYLNEDLVYYRDHADNTSKRISFMIEEHEQVLNDWSDEPSYMRAIRRHNLYSFVHSVKSKEKNLSQKYMKIAARKSFYHPKFIKTFLRYQFIK